MHLLDQQQAMQMRRDPRKNHTFEALQNEILKNRQEMNGQSISTEKENSIQQKTQRASGVPAQISNNPPINSNESVTKTQTVPVMGKVAFSSNHIMPAEKSNQKPLQATTNYYNIAPMGGAHEKK